MRSSKRKPLETLCSWERVGAQLPEEVAANETGMRLLEAARWTPSWANKQPWRCVAESGAIQLYKQARQVKEDKDYFLVDCGIAMAHIHLAAQALGVHGQRQLDAVSVPGAPEAAEPIDSYLLEDFRFDARLAS